MKLFEILLNEKSELSFLDLKKEAIKHVHKEFKLDAKTVFQPVTTKSDLKKALQDGELVVGFNPDGAYLAVGEHTIGGTYTTGRPKYGWISVAGDSAGKQRGMWGSWLGSIEKTMKLLEPFEHKFQSVDGRYEKESSSVTSNSIGLDKLSTIESEMQDKFATITNKVKQETIDKISDQVAELLKAGKTEEATRKIDELKGIRYRVERLFGHDILKGFLRDVYKENSSIFHADLGYALDRRKSKDSKFMLKLGLYMLKLARGERWTGRIFKGTKK